MLNWFDLQFTFSIRPGKYSVDAQTIWTNWIKLVLFATYYPLIRLLLLGQHYFVPFDWFEAGIEAIAFHDNELQYFDECASKDS